MKQTLLVVDDDIDALHLLCLILEKQGFTVLRATDGDEALQKAAKSQPDLILLDVTMPGKDGFEVTKLLKADEMLAKIPIIMLTARGDLDDKLIGFESGVDDYLTKPIQPKELIAHVQAVLARNLKKSEFEKTAPLYQRSYTLGVIAAKGGLGCSTLALALGLLLRENSNREVIIAEYRPGQGTLGFMLGIEDPIRIPQLFDVPLADLTIEQVEDILFHYSLPAEGNDDSKEKKEIRILLSSSHPGESKYIHQTELYKMITHLLAKICGYLILDLGTSLNPIAEKTLEQCDELIVITDTSEYTVQQTKMLIHALNSYGFNGNKVEVFVHKACHSAMSEDWQENQPEKENHYASLFVHKNLSVNEIEDLLNLPIYYNEGNFHRYWQVIRLLANHIIECTYPSLSNTAEI